jgi:deazaflavin-dependent oxidoreductase (nitroreductase family)
MPEQAPARPQGLDAPIVKTVMKRVARAQVWFYRRTNGRIGGRWRVGAGFRKPVPTLLLDHVGRRSGELFTTPLLYLEHGEDVVVVASQGGMAAHPQWFRNLQQTPDTQVQIGPELRLVTARVAGPDERVLLWPRLVDLYADFASYQSWTDREIPVVVLSPRRR